ncbi:STAS domain-containing protein [Chloroflexia bacterium SDU3-3]|nr:STAS domain-containing protein [Chloroflexia bacterium SDU3-3]
MAADSQRLFDFWSSRKDSTIESLAQSLRDNCGPYYQNLSQDELLKRAAAIIDIWLDVLVHGKPERLSSFSQQIGTTRLSEGLGPSVMMSVIDQVRKVVWQVMSDFYVKGDWDLDLLHTSEGWIHDMRSSFTETYNTHLQEAQRQLEEREHEIATQSQIIRETASPIVPIYDGILVMPLVGALDSLRISQVMESALEHIVDKQAEVLIIDITGVPIVDTGVANHLLQMARAISLLGAEVVVVGIGAEIAQTIIQLGLDMSAIMTMANLEAGIAYALEQRGFAIRTISEP